jgi:hypothetical protein
MDYTNDPTGTKGTNGTLANTQPSTTDFDHLAAIYANLDSTQIATTKPGNLMVAADAYDLPGFDHDVEPHSVPEPSSWALMVAGFLVAGSRLRRRAGARAVAA